MTEQEEPFFHTYLQASLPRAGRGRVHMLTRQALRSRKALPAWPGTSPTLAFPVSQGLHATLSKPEPPTRRVFSRKSQLKLPDAGQKCPSVSGHAVTGERSGGQRVHDNVLSVLREKRKILGFVKFYPFPQQLSDVNRLSTSPTHPFLHLEILHCTTFSQGCDEDSRSFWGKGRLAQCLTHRRRSSSANFILPKALPTGKLSLIL